MLSKIPRLEVWKWATMMIKRDQSSLESDKEKKNEKSERSENQRKIMVFFFFF